MSMSAIFTSPGRPEFGIKSYSLRIERPSSGAPAPILWLDDALSMPGKLRRVPPVKPQCIPVRNVQDPHFDAPTIGLLTASLFFRNLQSICDNATLIGLCFSEATKSFTALVACA